MSDKQLAIILKVIRPICAFCFDYNLDNPDFIQDGICPRCRAESITHNNMEEFTEILPIEFKDGMDITISAMRRNNDDKD